MKLKFKSSNAEKFIDLDDLGISFGKENEEKILNALKDIQNTNPYDLKGGTFIIEQAFLFGYPLIITKGNKNGI